MAQRLFDTLGHLAVWIGLYAGQSVHLVAIITGRSLSAVAWVGVVTLTIGVYLLDRVKPTDAWRDPADAVAHPERAAFMERFATSLRVTIVILAGCSSVLLWMTNPWLTVLVPISHLGVLCYASLPKRVRPKDVLLVKNLTVGLAITVMAAGVVVMSEDALVDWGRMTLACVVLLIYVTTDAMLCDLDDAEADAAFGTRTIPNVVGAARTWTIAMMANILAGTLLVGLADAVGLSRTTAVVVAGTLVVTVVLLRASGPAAVRDLTDMRLPIAVAAAWWTLQLLPA